MTDILYKGHFKGLDIAFAYAVTTQAVNEAVVRHDCDPAAAHILGRATTGALLAAAILPEGHRLNACWKYHGALKTIVVDAGQDGTVRSLISPSQLSEFGDVHDELYGEMGDLQVVVSKDGQIANSGTTPVSLHDPVNDLAYHYCISDQVETGMVAMIGFQPDPESPVQLCQGWMIQALPSTDLERFDRLRQRLDDPGFRELMGHGSASEAYFEQIATALIGEEAGFEGIQKEVCPSPKFQCTCSKAKMAAVVRSLPIPDRMTMVKRNEPVGISCQFCNERYELSIEECIVAWNQKNAE
ncbi:Hsp33 family molecular chaperone HslO [Pontiella sulfatireligans]|uniref:33 kDa chaperonin n=1 Tax=Pontiella sulfatireligans TaxID=2750658 RepID=A0A6C2UNR5_9BACT|nr:Hsp33 family molecular chaperone HslO [Pontiella sulfatireligans]VGO21828.1 33 kDa chaperonin [Pontiella sulfatireligans]